MRSVCCRGGLDPTPDEREYLFALYDSDIAAADDAVGLLLLALERDPCSRRGSAMGQAIVCGRRAES